MSDRFEIVSNHRQQSKGPKVSVVIPVLNRLDLTRACLVSLESTLPDRDTEIIVVDNASDDGTADALAGEFPAVTVLVNSRNVGFAAACNQGAREASGEVLVLLNNDTEAHEDWLGPMLEALDDPAVGIVGSRLLFPDGTLQHAGMSVIEDRRQGTTILTGIHRWYQMPANTPAALVRSEVQAVTGAVMAMRREVLLELGGLDEGYWNGCEDLDLCFKVRQHGMTVLYEPRSVLTHHESASGVERWTKVSDNLRRLTARWQGKIRPDLVWTASGGIVPTVDQHSTTTAHNNKAPAGPTIRWEGAAFSMHSLSQVNRELQLRLRADHGFVIDPVSTEVPDLSPLDDPRVTALAESAVASRRVAAPAVTVRHQWPPNWEPPTKNHPLVVIQPWEFGGLPADWVTRINSIARQYWVYTTWGRDNAVASGVDPERVRIVPLGVDLARFNPDGGKYRLETTATTKLLFLGGAIHRKGIDIVIEAFVRAFRPGDDVCLVIKSSGAHTHYRHNSLESRLSEFVGRSDLPEIELITDDLSQTDIADLYRACTALVHPYRGEGFGLPVAEAMASGLPVIVTADGSTADFCDGSNAWTVGSTRVPVTEETVGMEASPAGFWLTEPDVDAVAAAMRAVAARPDEVLRRGAGALETIRSRFSWDIAAEVAAKNIAEAIGTRRDPAGAAHSGTRRDDVLAPSQPVSATPAPRAARRSVLLVILASSARSATRQIETVQSQLRGSDRVVAMIDDPTTTPARAVRRGVTMMERPADLLAALIALSGTDLDVIVIDERVTMHGRHWLDRLGEPLANGFATAVPGSNAAPWPQCPSDAPYAGSTKDELRRYSRALTDTGPIAIQPNPGPVIAIDGDHLRTRVGSAHTVEELFAATDTGASCALVTSCYAHSSATMLVSACMIMKDEVDNLETCLSSLATLVDEIVIYDTGSRDGSIERARALGATVIEGYWDDDFSRARNAALAACRGDWVVHLDLDETIEEPASAGPAMRELLAHATNGDVIAVNLFNLEGSRIAPARSLAPNLVARFLRRLHCQWSGALHEEPVARPGRSSVRYTKSGVLTLLHSGYLSEAIAERNKRARNLRISSAEADKATDPDKAQFNLARSLLMAHQHGDAIEVFNTIATTCTQEVIRRSALELGADALREVGRNDEALEWGRRHSQENPSSGVGRLLQARALANLGRVEEAISLVEGLTDYNDRYSNIGSDGLAVFLAQAYLYVGRFDDALAQLRTAVQGNVRSAQAYITMASLAERAPEIDLTEALSSVPAEELTTVFSQLLNASPNGADRIAETFWARSSDDLATLAFASALAPRLDVERAVLWSRRLQDKGLGEASPLLGMVDGASSIDRVRLLAALVDDGDESRREQLESLVSAISDEHLESAFIWVLDEAIGAAESLIVAGATTVSRCLIIARTLAEHGHLNEAVAVYGHASAISSSPLPRMEDRLDAAMRAAAEQIGRTDVVVALDAALS